MTGIERTQPRTAPQQKTMSAKANDSVSNGRHLFIYMGQGSTMSMDVTHVRAHPSARVIADRGYSRCVKLVEVEPCGGLEEIGFHAFSNWKSLKRITIPSSVRSMNSWALWGCTGLVEVELCEGLQEIGFGAFLQVCKSLRNFAIPLTLWDGVFDEASALIFFPIQRQLKHRFDELAIHQI